MTFFIKLILKKFHSLQGDSRKETKIQQSKIGKIVEHSCFKPTGSSGSCDSFCVDLQTCLTNVSKIDEKCDDVCRTPLLMQED